jgi:hypothetical protein
MAAHVYGFDVLPGYGIVFLFQTAQLANCVQFLFKLAVLEYSGKNPNRQYADDNPAQFTGDIVIRIKIDAGCEYHDDEGRQQDAARHLDMFPLGAANKQCIKQGVRYRAGQKSDQAVFQQPD